MVQLTFLRLPRSFSDVNKTRIPHRVQRKSKGPQHRHAEKDTSLNSLDYDQISSRPLFFRVPEQHKVLFENAYVRVLRVTNPAGHVAPPHVHVWPSVVIMDEPADLVIRNENGTRTVDLCRKDANPRAYARQHSDARIE
jgi:hypothetical protein